MKICVSKSCKRPIIKNYPNPDFCQRVIALSLSPDSVPTSTSTTGFTVTVASQTEPGMKTKFNQIMIGCVLSLLLLVGIVLILHATIRTFNDKSGRHLIVNVRKRNPLYKKEPLSLDGLISTWRTNSSSQMEFGNISINKVSRNVGGKSPCCEEDNLILETELSTQESLLETQPLNQAHPEKLVSVDYDSPIHKKTSDFNRIPIGNILLASRLNHTMCTAGY